MAEVRQAAPDLIAEATPEALHLLMLSWVVYLIKVRTAKLCESLDKLLVSRVEHNVFDCLLESGRKLIECKQEQEQDLVTRVWLEEQIEEKGLQRSWVVGFAYWEGEYGLSPAISYK